MMHIVLDASVTIHQPPDEIDDELVGDGDTTERQALLRREADRFEPAIEVHAAYGHVPDVRSVAADEARTRYAGLEHLEQIAVARDQPDTFVVGRKVPVSSDQADRIRERRTPGRVHGSRVRPMATILFR